MVIPERIEREDGLIAFHLPAGPSHLDITYRTTPDQIIGNSISTAALCIFISLLYVRMRQRRSR